MHAVGAYEAKTHLPQLLARVAKGEKITITKHGKPVAVLVPPETQTEEDVRQTVKQMLAWRDSKGPRLGARVTVRELIEQGRRF